jgi:hypothetical protein
VCRDNDADAGRQIDTKHARIGPAALYQDRRAQMNALSPLSEFDSCDQLGPNPDRLPMTWRLLGEGLLLRPQPLGIWLMLRALIWSQIRR